MMRIVRNSLIALAITTSGVSAQPAPDDPDGQTLGVLEFSSSSPRVKRAHEDRVKQIATWHVRNPNTLLVIESFAPRGGSRSKRLRLSQDRTDSVRDALIMAGADRNRMVLIAHPDAQPDTDSKDARVRVRALGQYTELVSEQRDPQVGEDARAARRTVSRRDATAARGRALDEQGDTERAPAEAIPPRGGNTIVIVPPGAGGSSAPLAVEETADDLANAGGPERTSGGNGTSAQTGLGFDPTDEFHPVGVGFTGGRFGLEGNTARGFSGSFGTVGLGTGGRGRGR
jgi:outer membrane protein OmpA-like peptidoglycan-associated protein